MAQENQLTPEQALQILGNFIRHPAIRCFNVAEYETAFAALGVLEQAVKPVQAENVVQLPTHADK